MPDERYEYNKINAIKVIVQDKDHVLLVREPLTNEWMPGHWGLPGGKPFASESLLEAYERKIAGELGVKLELKGLFQIVELLIESRTVLMFVVAASYLGGELSGESSEYRWITREELQKMDISEFTEYYNKEMLLAFLSNPENVFPVELIRTYPYFKMADEPDYQKWKESGGKK